MEAHLKLTPEFAAHVKKAMAESGYSAEDVKAIDHKLVDGTFLKIILANLPEILKLFGVKLPGS